VPAIYLKGVIVVKELLFTKEHEWVRIENDTAIVGITGHAQEKLGDIVYVELPEVGLEFDKDEGACVIESVKAASDIYSPLSGTIVEVNEALEDEPQLINSSPYDKGWILKINDLEQEEIDTLMSAEEYRELIKS